MFNPGFTAPLLCPCPQVTVFHDLQHKRHPEYFRWFDLPFWNFFLFWSAQVSRLLLADSAATAGDLRRYYRMPESRIGWSGWAWTRCSSSWRRRRRPERFLLAVSTLHPHKNLDGLLRAFARFPDTAHPEYRLVVCGMHGFFTGRCRNCATGWACGIRSNFPAGFRAKTCTTCMPARGPSSILRCSKDSGCRCWKAWRRRCPTACSDIEPIAGIAGGAALQFDPRDADGMAAALERIATDEGLRARLAEAGPRRAAEFSWVGDGAGDVGRADGSGAPVY